MPDKIVKNLLPTILIVSALCAGMAARSDAPELAAGATEWWCDLLPREANEMFERVASDTDWFDVRLVADGVYALIEPDQFQEVISYLIIGEEQALLFDTGLGMSPIRPVIEQLTALPVMVLNSHTHFDHIGGNAEFDRVLAFNSPYTMANQRGFPHSELAGEAAPDAFCSAAPAGFDAASYHTRAWSPTGMVADGDTLDLGGRVLEVIHVPGHTPDALALIDRENGLLWTGDTYYDGAIWIYVPETDLDLYQNSLDRLAELAPSVKRLLPAHNTVSAAPANLVEAARAIRLVRSGEVPGEEQSNQRVVFRFEDFSFLTSKPLLEGKKGDSTAGGSGLTTWP